MREPSNNLTAGSSSEPARLITLAERGAEPRPATNLPRLESVEQALDVIGGRIADDQFAEEVRKILADGYDAKYTLIVKASDTGYKVILGCRRGLPNKQLFAFQKLL